MIVLSRGVQIRVNANLKQHYVKATHGEKKVIPYTAGNMEVSKLTHNNKARVNLRGVTNPKLMKIKMYTCQSVTAAHK